MLFGGRLGSAAQSADTVDDAMTVGVAGCLDQVTTLIAVAALGLRRGASREVPLDAVTFTTGATLAAGLDDRPPEDALLGGWRGNRGRRLARGTFGAVSIGGGFDRGCS